MKKNHNIVRLLALSLFLTATGFASNSFAAGYKVNIDCYGTNGQPTWAGTTNYVTIDARINSAWDRVGRQKISNALCVAYGDTGITFSRNAFSPSKVSSIRVDTSGTDCFWIDRIRLKNESGTITNYWGVNNNTGYCVSGERDPNAHCLNGRSYNTWTFNK